jgi:hypothetical protein
MNYQERRQLVLLARYPSSSMNSMQQAMKETIFQEIK